MKKKMLNLVGIILIIIIGIVLWKTIKVEDIDKKQEDNELWSEGQNVNKPMLLEGMKAIIFEEGKETTLELKKEEMTEGIWYDYIEQEKGTEEGGTSKWANAMTLDGSMWVWIPRYAYKIEWNSEEKGKIDIVFLKGTTNYNKDGKDVTKLGYTVHPAFKNGKNNQYRNGEWDKEIEGIWISKFESGYANQENTGSANVEIVNTNLKYERNAANILRRNKRTRNIYYISRIYGKDIFIQ